MASIGLPTSIKRVGESAFSECYSLNNIELPFGMTDIPGCTFASCTSLTGIEIPSSVTSIGFVAFCNCTSLTSITFLSDTPATLDGDVLLESAVEAIYVPASAVDTYKSHEDWAKYKEIIFPIENTDISEIKYGDVDGNGEISASDVLLLRKYMANYDYDTNTSTVTVQAGADVDGSGEIGAADVLLLRKYMANYDYETGVSSIVLGPKS